MKAEVALPSTARVRQLGLIETHLFRSMQKSLARAIGVPAIGSYCEDGALC